jgi:hypothetical protein
MSPVSPEDKKKKGFDDWEKEGFARDLIRAEEIKNDPKKLAAATEALNKQTKAANQAKMSIERLKEISSNIEIEDSGMVATSDIREDAKHEKKNSDKKEDKKAGEKVS